MTLNEFFTRFFPKAFYIFGKKNSLNNFLNWKSIFYVFLVLLFFAIFVFISNLINQNNKVEKHKIKRT